MRHRFARWVLLPCTLLAAVVLAAGSAGAAPKQQEAAPAAAPALHTLTDQQLSDMAFRLQGDAERAGMELLGADEAQQRVSQDRDVALMELQAWLAQAYKSGAGSSTLAVQLLLGGGIRGAGDGMRLLRAIGSHQASVLRSLDDAEAALQVSSLRRAKIIQRLTAWQAQLQQVQAEQERRTAIRDERRAERERAAAQKAAETMASVPGALVAAPAGGAMPGVGGAVSPSALDAYLASKGSPMTGYGAAFVQSGARYRVDPRLLVAIAGAESNFGAITCGPNNAWGWACPNDPESFETWAHGIDTVTRGLRQYYLDEGRTSVTLIQQKYCPVGAANDPTGLNSHWSANVTRFLLELGGNPSNVGPGPLAGLSMVPDLGGLGMLGD